MLTAGRLMESNALVRGLLFDGGGFHRARIMDGEGGGVGRERPRLRGDIQILTFIVNE